jgi:hypothetical protein
MHAHQSIGSTHCVPSAGAHTLCSFAFALQHQVNDVKSAQTLLWDFESSRMVELGVLVDVYKPSVASYMILIKTLKWPPAFGDAVFRERVNALLMYAGNLSHEANSTRRLLLDGGECILANIKDRCQHSCAELNEVAGGSNKKGASWKDSLAETCSLEVMEDRYKQTLSKCQGGKMNEGAKKVAALLEEINSHVALMESLESVGTKARNVKDWHSVTMDACQTALDQMRASRLEFYVLRTYFSQKDATDKKEYIKKMAIDFDKYDADGSKRKKWIHVLVTKLQNEITSHNPAPAEDAGKAQKRRKL